MSSQENESNSLDEEISSLINGSTNGDFDVEKEFYYNDTNEDTRSELRFDKGKFDALKCILM